MKKHKKQHGSMVQPGSKQARRLLKKIRKVMGSKWDTVAKRVPDLPEELVEALG